MIQRPIGNDGLRLTATLDSDAGQYLVEAVSMVKNFAADVALSVCQKAVQLHGGMGYMRNW